MATSGCTCIWTVGGTLSTVQMDCPLHGDLIDEPAPMPLTGLISHAVDYVYPVPQMDADGYIKLGPSVLAQLDRIEEMLLAQTHGIESRWSMGGSVGVRCECGWSSRWRWEDHRDENWPKPEAMHAEHLKSLMPERTPDASTPQNPNP